MIDQNMNFLKMDNQYLIGEVVWIRPSNATPREATIKGYDPTDGVPLIRYQGDNGEWHESRFSTLLMSTYNDRPDIDENING
jgi:hypothetical protein